jgi:hypothetical protein
MFTICTDTAFEQTFDTDFPTSSIVQFFSETHEIVLPLLDLRTCYTAVYRIIPHGFTLAIVVNLGQYTPGIYGTILVKKNLSKDTLGISGKFIYIDRITGKYKVDHSKTLIQEINLIKILWRAFRRHLNLWVPPAYFPKASNGVIIAV